MQARRIYQFGSFGLDPKAHLLLKDGEPVHLTRKAAETLLLLVQQSPNVVSKEELLAAVWPDQIADEHNLTQNISTARRALKVPPGNPGYIETFPGHGYRILGPVSLSEVPAPVAADIAAAEPPENGHPAGFEGTAAPIRESAWKPGSFRRNTILVALAAVVIFAAALAGLRLLSGPVADRTPLRIAPLSRLGGRQYQPAVSPDGKTVAFLWQKEAADLPRIWLQGLHETTPHALTGKEGEYSSPAWSPDSRSIACLRFRENSADLVIVDPVGGAENPVVQVLPTRFGLSHRHLDWSPDGEWIAIDDAPSLGSPLAIYLVNVKTGAKTRITQPDDRILGDVAPRFSPDGKQVSFIRVPHRAYQQLIIVPLHGGAETVIDSSEHEISDQSWLPNPRSLVFASDRDGAFRIWKTPAARQRSSRDLLATAVYGEFPIQFAVTPHQSGLVYSVLGNDQAIWRLDLAEPQTAKRWMRLIGSAGRNASPQYSPDGSRICFRSDRSGKEQLWIAQADGSGAFPITSGSNVPSVPRWSPDSRAVLFNTANGEMMVAAERDGKWTASSLHAPGIHPVYSPNGQWIYAGSDRAILRYPATGGSPVTVVPLRALSLDVSPDGQTLYFVRQTADIHLWSFNLATGRLSRVLEGLVPYCSSCWVPTAEGIYFLGSQSGSLNQHAIFLHNLRSSHDELTAAYPEPVRPFGIGPFSISPDRRYLLTVRIDLSSTDLLHVEPFR